MELWRDADLLGVFWENMETDYVANTGSGLTGLKATQACDCNVPTGKHDYKVVLASSPDGWMASVEVVDHLEEADPPAEPAEDTGASADVFPWDIPEPAEIQGLDCTVECGDIEPEQDLGTPEVDAGGGPQPQEDTGGVAPQVDAGTGPQPQPDAGTAPQSGADAGPTTPGQDASSGTAPGADGGGTSDDDGDGGCTAGRGGTPWALGGLALFVLLGLGVLRRE